MKTIGKRIKYLRDSLNLSQQDVADSTGISRGNMSNYEKDRVSPGVDAIIALCEFFNVSADWLITGRGKKPRGDVVVLTESSGQNYRTIIKVRDIKDKSGKKLVYMRMVEEEKLIISMYRDFTDKDKAFIKNIILLKHGQIKQDRKKKNAS